LSRLIRAAAEAESGNIEACRNIVSSLQEGHVKAASANLQDPGILANVTAEISEVIQALMNIITAAIMLREVSPRTLDTIIGKGEILSCHLMVALLHDRGIDAQLVDLANITPGEAPREVNQAFYATYATALLPILAACGSRVPVVTGFFGPVPGGLLTQVGRGYTDLCAALVSIALSASELQIWKEVDGIFSADPRKVVTARLLQTITPAEAAELTFFGSEVLHPFTMEQIVRQCIPIRIKNTTKPAAAGTLVVPDPIGPSTECTEAVSSISVPSLFRTRRSRAFSLNERIKRPTAVTAKNKILVINVHSNKRSFSHGYFAGIFSVLDKWRMSVDLISSTETNISMAFHCHREFVRGKNEERRIVDTDLQGAVLELTELGEVNLVDALAIVSLVGKDLKNMTGIAGKMTTVLGDNGINIEMIAQGRSPISVVSNSDINAHSTPY
jgi:aspartate kinase